MVPEKKSPKLLQPLLCVGPGTAPWACNMCSYKGPMLRRAPDLAEYSTGAVLKYLMIFEQGALDFHFALDLKSYVAGSG